MNIQYWIAIYISISSWHTKYTEAECDSAYRLRPPRAVLVSEAEVQTEAMQEPEPEQVFLESTPAPPSPRTPRKKSKVWMGNFADMFTSKPMWDFFILQPREKLFVSFSSSHSRL